MKHFKNLLSLNIKTENENNIGNVNEKSPREHQRAAQSKMTKFFIQERKKAGILVLPTGGGKTYTAVYWLLKNIIAKKKKVLWLADKGFLLEQTFEAFRENILEVGETRREIVNIRVVSGSNNHGNPNQIEVSDDILLVTSQTAISNWDTTMSTRLKKFIEYNSNDLFIVYDEAHHTPAFGRRNLLIGGSENKTGIIEKFSSIQLLGLTATPTYTNKNQRAWLWEIFPGKIIYEVSKKRLEDVEVLAHPHFIQQKTNFNPVLSDADVEKISIKHQEIPTHIIEELAENEERNNFIANYYLDNKREFGKTLIFLDRWYQCMMIEKYINKSAGKIIAASIFSYVDTNKNIDYINQRTSDENDRNLDKFRKGELQVLINVKMLTEGIDVPDVKTVFITRDTNSKILFTQMVGRALRGKKAGGNKETANIVLFSDNWNRHVLFASDRFSGDSEDSDFKERGYRPFELIRIDLLDKLELEYQNQNYETSIYNLLPIGWYVVTFMDTVSDEIDSNDNDKTTESFTENVLVLESEEEIFKLFISRFSDYHKETIWEMEQIDYDIAEGIIMKFLEENNFVLNKVILSKFIQIARHLGQNRNEPEYFTFVQKKELDLMPLVVNIREEQYGPKQIEDYLKNVYDGSSNPFLKSIFPTEEHFYQAYKYENEVFRKLERSGLIISEPNQEIKVKRLASKELRKEVLSRDHHKCLCCGKTNNLQVDHIISFKEKEPDDGDPNLFQTLCSICNREKSVFSYNYRITKFDPNKMGLKNVQKGRDEDPKFYFTRLINCYYKTNAVHKDSVSAFDRGNSIWTAKTQLVFSPEKNILEKKDELLQIIRAAGYNLKDLRIESH